jgi:hypothetical protein
MKTLKAVILFSVVALVAPAQTINKTVGAGAGNQTVLEIPGVAGKVIVIEALCWGAESVNSTSAAAVSIAAYDGEPGQPGAHGLLLFMTPHAAAATTGVAVVPNYCTPAHLKMYTTAGQEFYVYFNTGIANVAQSITVSGHYE